MSNIFEKEFNGMVEGVGSDTTILEPIVLPESNDWRVVYFDPYDGYEAIYKSTDRKVVVECQQEKYIITMTNGNNLVESITRDTLTGANILAKAYVYDELTEGTDTIDDMSNTWNVSLTALLNALEGVERSMMQNLRGTANNYMKRAVYQLKHTTSLAGDQTKPLLKALKKMITATKKVLSDENANIENIQLCIKYEDVEYNIQDFCLMVSNSLDVKGAVYDADTYANTFNDLSTVHAEAEELGASVLNAVFGESKHKEVKIKYNEHISRYIVTPILEGDKKDPYAAIGKLVDDGEFDGAKHIASSLLSTTSGEAKELIGDLVSEIDSEDKDKVGYTLKKLTVLNRVAESTEITTLRTLSEKSGGKFKDIVISKDMASTILSIAECFDTKTANKFLGESTQVILKTVRRIVG